MSTGFVPMLPVLGAASLVTFVLAAVGYPAAALLWITGRAGAARVVGSVAGAGLAVDGGRVPAAVGWMIERRR